VVTDDPAVQAAIEAGAQHSVPTPSLGIQCSCGADIPTLAAREAHSTAVRVTAARPIIAWEIMQNVLADLAAARNDAHRLAGKLSSLRPDVSDAALRAGAQRPDSAAVRTEPEQ
jgi:hypothetical protein